MNLDVLRTEFTGTLVISSHLVVNICFPCDLSSQISKLRVPLGFAARLAEQEIDVPSQGVLNSEGSRLL
jgi:hypothetical protein